MTDPRTSTSPVGLHRVLEPCGVLPQAAARLDTDPRIRADEVRVRVERLNLDAASYRQLHTAHGGDPEAVRREVLAIIDERGKMQNPVTGSGGMLVGVVEEVGPGSPLGLKPGDRIATLVSLTLTPLAITDGLARWDGRSEQIPAEGHAILFARSIAAVLPADLPVPLALSVMDVCGAPALTHRVVRRYKGPGGPASGDPAPGGPVVAVLGAAGKSGSLSLAAARRAGAARTIGLVPIEDEERRLAATGLADRVVRADARDPVAVAEALGEPADVTVVCVDVPGCEHGAILATAPGGTVIFFSMATSFAAAALGAEGLAADVTMLVGNGYVPGHVDLALDLFRSEPAIRALFTAREGGEQPE
ncbi:L-erythro-3,5-diaminohexanoate dehydrogenase [Spirillospora sp. NPDC048911]|uniref:L-erythro-3,5-diaminohexanoate dehydrogenase n=1 Tax=Spirillospora sp. NPDC048911 TaxID=3364527 RepID=UPI0037193438